MADFQVVARLVADASQFASGVNQAKGQLNSLQSLGSNLTSVGSALTKGITLPILGAGAAAIKLGTDFDDQMSTVGAVAGVQGDQLEALSNHARELGKTTRYSAREAAQGQEYLARAGFEVDDILKAQVHTLNLATAGGLDLASATDIAAQTMHGFGLGVDDMGHVSNVLAKASGDANTTVGLLGRTFRNVAPVASASGMSLEEVSAAAMILADNGLRGAQAGSALKSGLLDLAAPTDVQAAKMAELGINVYDAEGNMKSMSGIVAELEQGLEGMTQEQRNHALAAIFSEGAIGAWTDLVSAGSEEIERLEKGLINSTDAAQNMADDMENNLAGSIRAMKSAFEESLLAIRDAFENVTDGALRRFIDGITDLLHRFSDLDADTLAWIVTLAGVAAAIGPILVMIGSLINALGTIGTAASAAFAFLTSGVGLATVAIVGLVAGFTYLMATNEEFRAAVMTAWSAIKEKAHEVFDAIAPIAEAALSSAAETVRSIWGSLVSWWEANNERITTIVQTAWAIIQTIISVAMAMIVPRVQAAWEMISNIIQAAIDIILNIVQLGMSLLTLDFQGAWEALGNIVRSAVILVVQIVGSFIDMLVNIFNNFVELAGGSWEAFWNKVMDIVVVIMSAVVNFIADGWEKLSEITSTVWEFITELISTAWEFISELVSSAITAVVEFISSGWDSVKEFTSQTWESIKELISSAWESITGTINSVLSGIISFISSSWQSISSTTTSVWNSISSFISNVWNTISSTISSVMSSISSSISSAWNDVKSTTSNILNSIKSTITNIFNSFKGIVSSAFSGVVSAVSSGMDNALSTVTGFLGSFKEAGRNIVSNIAAGIRGAIGMVRDAIGSVASAIRNALPFSPPKDKSSPLVDIHKHGIGTQIAAGIKRGESTMTGAMAKSLSGVQRVVDRNNIDYAGLFDGTNDLTNDMIMQAQGSMTHQFTTDRLELEGQSLELNLSLGGKNYRTFVSDITKQQELNLELRGI